MKINIPELDNVNRQRHNLLNLLDKKQITEEEFNNKFPELDKKRNELIWNYLKIDNVDVPKKDNIIQTEETKMAEETKKVKAVKEVKEKPLNEQSNAQLILRALQLKSTKNYDDVAAKVVEWKPTAVANKVKSMAKVMVNEIVKGKGGKATKYAWDETNFMLTLKA